ncbi:PLP-dependent aminotransferase family protein [Alteribacter populi]|uniref:MocR-like pyridoxine biosynthesis transcription factor PdxR n=1 Tax=Alteribacter populi TaxID=2011011 RepID=UPI000BBA8727|nr:PLP-dependent aminotransferase family protein [Alteribacter populi]
MWLQVNRNDKRTLTQQVYGQIREKILSSEFKENEKLPSSRELSQLLNVSRNVVIEVNEQLISEGYLYVQERSGTYVAEGVSFQKRPRMQAPPLEKTAVNVNKDMIDFKAGNPGIDRFPKKVWGKLSKEVCIDSPKETFSYHQPGGSEHLRKVLTDYLLRHRGIHCHQDQIVITSGATQGLSMLTNFLNKNQGEVAVEDPVTDEMRTIFTSAGKAVVPVPVDENGILTSQLPKESTPSFVFVIPSHQFPLGGTLPIQRRIQLIEYAREMNTYIVEDDYDSEFTYDRSPVPAVYSLDDECVIYVGTFSKILSPALRIGYVILPPHLVEGFRELKWYTDRHSASLDQGTLARFIEEGYMERHIRKMKRVYQKRRDTLVSAIQKAFPEAIIFGQSAGMHLVVKLPKMNFNESLMRKLKKEGVIVYPVENYSLLKGDYCEHIVMGYGGLSVDEIEKGVEIIKKVVLNGVSND